MIKKFGNMFSRFDIILRRVTGRLADILSWQFALIHTVEGRAVKQNSVVTRIICNVRLMDLIPGQNSPPQKSKSFTRKKLLALKTNITRCNEVAILA